MKLLHGLYKILNTCIIGALILCFLSPFVSPKFFWPITLFSLSFAFWLVVSVFMLVWGVMLKSKHAIYLLVCVLIGTPLINRSMAFNSKKTIPTENTFRVASFNCFSFEHKVKNAEKLDDFLEDNEVDIAILQEWRRTVSIRTKFHYPYNKVFKHGVNTGVQILSKYPIVNSGKIELLKTYSDAAWADVRMGKDTIRFYLLHLESNLLNAKDYRRIKSLELDDPTYTEHAKGMLSRLKMASKKRADQVQIVKRHMEESPHPVIICTDLNDTPQSYAYQHLSSGIKDAFMKAGSGWDGTFLKPFPFLRIDYILFDAMYECHSYESVKQDFSDHKLIFATFTKK